MRESRMTFGEHLEELRRRIAISLIYLAVGVVVAFIYGDVLLQWALAPHRTAFATAQRSRMLQRMEKTMKGILPLTTMEPWKATLGNRPIVGENDFHWEAIFAGDLVRSRMTAELIEPWRESGAELARLTTLTPPERQALASLLEKIGRSLAEILVPQIAVDLELSGVATLKQRFRNLEARLRALQVEETSGAGGSLKSTIGWGAGLETIIQYLSEFNGFLERKSQEILQSSVPTEELRRWSQNADEAEGLKEVIRILERSFETFRSPIENQRIIALDYTEQFTAYLKVAMVFGIFLSAPFVLYELWKFVGSGLYLDEQRYVVTFMPFSLGLFMAGVLFGYFIMIPVGLAFLASWGSTDVELSFALGPYVGLFLTLSLILGVIFQLPLIMVFLAKVGIVDVSLFRRARRISIFISLCLAVVLTPPDPFSWSLMIVPMIILYELGIIVCQFLTKKTKEPAS